MTAFAVRPDYQVHLEQTYSAADEPFLEPADACETDERDLATAVEAWFAMHGTTSDLTQDVLVRDGYLANVVDSFRLIKVDDADVDIEAVPGGDCA